MVRRLYPIRLHALLTRCALVMVTLAMGITSVAAQTTVSLNAPDTIDDTFIRGGDYATSNFDGQPLATRASSNASYVRRALLKFDTANTIPAGSSVTSAVLTLTIRASNTESRKIGAYYVNESFLEGDATWKVRKSGNAWKAFGGTLGDLYATATAGTSTGSTVKFDVTTLVNQTVKGSFGSRYTRIALVDTGSSSNLSHKEYYSSEDSDSSRRPVLTVTYGSTATPVSSTSGTALKVLHWNTHHGVGTDGRYDLNRIASWIAKLGPDVVSLNEVEKNDYWGDEDQPARYKSLLESKTGKRWYYVFAQRYGDWSSDGQGNVVLSRIPFDSTARYALSYDRSAALGRITVNGRSVNVISTHLDSDSGSRRLTQAGQLLSWFTGFAEQRIMAGDFNEGATASAVTKITGTYYDGWAKAKSLDVEVAYDGNTSGATRNSRIDYVFYSRNAGRLELKKAQVFDTRDSDGKMPSDHRPLMLTFAVD